MISNRVQVLLSFSGQMDCLKKINFKKATRNFERLMFCSKFGWNGASGFGEKKWKFQKFTTTTTTEKTTLIRKTHFHLSLKLRQALNRIKLNQKIVIRNVVTKRMRDRIFIVLKTVCPKTQSYHAFLVFNRIYINCI